MEEPQKQNTDLQQAHEPLHSIYVKHCKSFNGTLFSFCNDKAHIRLSAKSKCKASLVVEQESKAKRHKAAHPRSHRRDVRKPADIDDRCKLQEVKERMSQLKPTCRPR